MDERRALVAVVLIFLILFGYNYFMGGRRQQEAVESPVATEETVVERESAERGESARTEGEEGSERETDSSPGVGQPTAAAGAAARTITVDAPLWSATLSTRGAAVVSWRLREYEDADGAGVELVPEGQAGFGVEFGYGADVLRTSEWVFESEAGDRVLVEKGAGPEVVTFTARLEGGAVVSKEYTFSADRYAFDLAVGYQGLGARSVEREMSVSWPGVEPTEEKEEDTALASAVMVDGGIDKVNFRSLRKENEWTRVGEITWATSQSKYFMVALVPDGGDFDEVVGVADPESRAVGFVATRPVEGASGTVRYRAYAGPQDYIEIERLGVELERAVDLGWSITRPLSVLMLRALVWAHRWIPNYGLVIILFSILTKLLFYRLTHKSFSEMKRMQDLQPKMKELQEKFKNDKEGLAKAQMELYRREKVNPMGGCLPMLLQMPVFIALFQVLRTTIELRGAPFALWITDLSQPDTIAMIGSFPIHILPLLMGVGMLVQQRFSSQDPSQAAIGKMMPIIFTALFYNFASGLVLYWLVNTVLSVWQQYYIHRGSDAAETDAGAVAAPVRVTSDNATSTTQVPGFAAGDPAEGQASNPGPQKKSSGRGGKRRKKRKK